MTQKLSWNDERNAVYRNRMALQHKHIVNTHFHLTWAGISGLTHILIVWYQKYMIRKNLNFHVSSATIPRRYLHMRE